MSIHSLTMEKIAELKGEATKAAARVEYFASITGRKLWADDLDAFEEVNTTCMAFSTPVHNHTWMFAPLFHPS